MIPPTPTQWHRILTRIPTTLSARPMRTRVRRSPLRAVGSGCYPQLVALIASRFNCICRLPNRHHVRRLRVPCAGVGGVQPRRLPYRRARHLGASAPTHLSPSPAMRYPQSAFRPGFRHLQPYVERDIMTQRRATRRRFLMGCSAIASVGLAGCTGGDESTATDSTPSPTDDGDPNPRRQPTAAGNRHRDSDAGPGSRRDARLGRRRPRTGEHGPRS